MSAIKRWNCSLLYWLPPINGQEIFSATLYPAIVANPFITFHTVATESGTIAFKWTGDKGFVAEASADITVA